MTEIEKFQKDSLDWWRNFSDVLIKIVANLEEENKRLKEVNDALREKEVC